MSAQASQKVTNLIAQYWRTRIIRSIVLNDVYRPHVYEEIEAMITPEVAGRLDKNKRYGVWWFNRERISRKQIAEPSPDGRLYRKTAKTTAKSKEEWIAVPVPDPGIPREVVDAAREARKDNKKCSSAGSRFWELSGGVSRCAE